MATKLGLVVTVATRHVTQHGIMTNGITSFKMEFRDRLALVQFTKDFPIPYNQMEYEIIMTEYELCAN